MCGQKAAAFGNGGPEVPDAAIVAKALGEACAGALSTLDEHVHRQGQTCRIVRSMYALVTFSSRRELRLSETSAESLCRVVFSTSVMLVAVCDGPKDCGASRPYISELVRFVSVLTDEVPFLCPARFE